MAGILDELSNAVAAVAAGASGAVVGVGASGSGVLVAPGRVLTNAHNVRGEEMLVTLADGRRETAHLAGVDAEGDLAVLEVAGAGDVVARWGASTPRAGEIVVALANPGGQGTRVSIGVVSALGVAFRGPSGRRVAGGIEHSAPLRRGSSGGALLDRGGALVGINTARQGDGYYVAVPADAALRARVEALARGEVPERIRLGVALAPPAVAARLRRAVGLPEREGLLVQGVAADGPAARAGIADGDLLVSAGGRALRSVDDLAEARAVAASVGTIEILVVRGVEERSLTVELTPAPD